MNQQDWISMESDLTEIVTSHLNSLKSILEHHEQRINQLKVQHEAQATAALNLWGICEELVEMDCLNPYEKPYSTEHDCGECPVCKAKRFAND